VWLIFAWRRKFGAYDHAVFVTYSLCFMSLLLVALTALGQVPAVPGWLLALATVLIPPVHIYKQLKGAYGLSRFSATWRTMVLLVFITIVLALFLDLLLVLGAMG
jgi:phosphatidylglycerophosphate synthase